MNQPTDRPRPTPGGAGRRAPGSARPTAVPAEIVAAHPGPRPAPTVSARTRPAGSAPVTRIEVQPAQLVAAAGSAIVTAARVGRLLGRSGWRIARQLPGARTVEREAQRLQSIVTGEARRVLQAPAPTPGTGSRAASAAEQHAVAYVATADRGTAPLRSAMSELLERSVESSRTDSREYLYGTIISQLVPDEARILSALADGAHYAAVDVVQKHRRGSERVVLANASTIGRLAGLVSPDNTPTYLTRLQNFGLVEFGPEEEALAVQYDILATDSTVQEARIGIGGRGAVKFARKSLRMSAFGARFWDAVDPSRAPLPPT